MNILKKKKNAFFLAALMIASIFLYTQTYANQADEDTTLSIPNNSGCNNFVYVITTQNDGKVLVGGLFTGYNGATANYIIRLNTDGSRDASFSIGSGFNQTINSLTMQNDKKIIVGGNFTSYKDISAGYIVRLRGSFLGHSYIQGYKNTNNGSWDNIVLNTFFNFGTVRKSIIIPGNEYKITINATNTLGRETNETDFIETPGKFKYRVPEAIANEDTITANLKIKYFYLQ